MALDFGPRIIKDDILHTRLSGRFYFKFFFFFCGGEVCGVLLRIRTFLDARKKRGGRRKGDLGVK